MGTLNAIVCSIFLLAVIYTWLWLDEAAGIFFITKNILSLIGVRISPAQLRTHIYGFYVKLIVDIIVSWFFAL